MSSTEPALSSIDDFRDIGVALRLRAGRPVIRERMLYLCGSVEDATESDNARLRNEYAIKTLVDYGSKRRLRAFPDDFTTANPPNMEYKMTHFGIVKVMGIQYCWSSLTPNAYVMALRKRLPLWKKAKSAHYALNDQLERMTEIYVGAMEQRGMINDTFDRLEHAQPEIRELFNSVLSHRASYPVLLSGKPLFNEPGLILLLILLLIDMPITLINEDLTHPLDALERAAEETTLTVVKLLQAEIVQNRVGWAAAVKNHLDSKYGGAEAYLESAGVTLASRDAVKHILLADAEAEELVDL